MYVNRWANKWIDKWEDLKMDFRKHANMFQTCIYIKYMYNHVVLYIIIHIHIHMYIHLFRRDCWMVAFNQRTTPLCWITGMSGSRHDTPWGSLCSLRRFTSHHCDHLCLVQSGFSRPGGRFQIWNMLGHKKKANCVHHNVNMCIYPYVMSCHVM